MEERQQSYSESHPMFNLNASDSLGREQPEEDVSEEMEEEMEDNVMPLAQHEAPRRLPSNTYSALSASRAASQLQKSYTSGHGSAKFQSEVLQLDKPHTSTQSAPQQLEAAAIIDIQSQALLQHAMTASQVGVRLVVGVQPVNAGPMLFGSARPLFSAWRARREVFQLPRSWSAPEASSRPSWTGRGAQYLPPGCSSRRTQVQCSVAYSYCFRS